MVNARFVPVINPLANFTLRSYNTLGRTRWIPIALSLKPRPTIIYANFHAFHALHCPKYPFLQSSPGRWPDICWITTPVYRLAKPSKKQAIKEQRRLRANSFQRATPCSREGRHSSLPASLNADSQREIAEIPEMPVFHAHRSTTHRIRTLFHAAAVCACFCPVRALTSCWLFRSKDAIAREILYRTFQFYNSPFISFFVPLV